MSGLNKSLILTQMCASLIYLWVLYIFSHAWCIGWKDDILHGQEQACPDRYSMGYKQTDYLCLPVIHYSHVPEACMHAFHCFVSHRTQLSE